MPSQETGRLATSPVNAAGQDPQPSPPPATTVPFLSMAESTFLPFGLPLLHLGAGYLLAAMLPASATMPPIPGAAVSSPTGCSTPKCKRRSVYLLIRRQNGDRKGAKGDWFTGSQLTWCLICCKDCSATFSAKCRHFLIQETLGLTCCLSI